MVTGVSMSEQRRRLSATQPIVVGVDVGGRSTSAVLWAAEEAERSGRSLRLISAYPKEPTPDTDEDTLRNDLAGLARRLTVADLEYRVDVGSAPSVLLKAVESSSLLVVGRRGRGGVHRRLIGSTSIAVAGRSPVPVVVVPEQWLQPRMSSAPVVVGVELPHVPMQEKVSKVPQERQHLDQGQLARNGAILDFAFERARDLKVPLIVVNAFEIPAIYGWSADDITDYRARSEQALEDLLRPWRDENPDVDVDARCVAETPKQAMLDAAGVAQLTVLGRHPGGHLPGSPIGSTTRGVLHHAEHPVAIVPVTTAEASS
ncbi:MAG: universal stress protein [Nocardioidaceae bacterium]